MQLARLLVLAEEPATAELIASMLRLRGHQAVETASSATEALELARSSHFDLALVDLPDGMAEQAGLRTARRLGWSHSVPSLLIAAEPQRVQAGYVGCGVLGKPHRTGAIAPAVEAALTMLRTGEVPAALPEGVRLWLSTTGGPGAD